MSLQPVPHEANEVSLYDLLDTALTRGVVLEGDVTISVADVDLVFLGLRLVLASVETLETGQGRLAAPQQRTGLNPLPPAGLGRPALHSDLAAGPQGLGAVPLPQRREGSPRPAADTERMEHGLAKLVLTVVELLRRLLEQQAIRRLQGGSLSEAQVERMGQAFQRLERKMEELKQVFGLEGDDLNLSLGPLGNLM